MTIGQDGNRRDWVEKNEAKAGGARRRPPWVTWGYVGLRAPFQARPVCIARGRRGRAVQARPIRIAVGRLRGYDGHVVGQAELDHILGLNLDLLTLGSG